MSMFDDEAEVTLTKRDPLTGAVDHKTVKFCYLEPWRPFNEVLRKHTVDGWEREYK